MSWDLFLFNSPFFSIFHRQDLDLVSGEFSSIFLLHAG